MAEQSAVSVFQKFLPIPKAMIARHAVLMGNANNLLILPLRKSIMPIIRTHFLIMNFIMPIIAFMMWVIGGINYYWSGRSRISRVLLKAITGDKLAREKFFRHVKYLRDKFQGYPK